MTMPTSASAVASTGAGTAAQPLCFVAMGFGKKTDYSDTPRSLNLDATYEAIIKPAVTACGLRCVRADEVRHSGIIDGPMYEMLLRADLVIADISTANPNAIYELGVRGRCRWRHSGWHRRRPPPVAGGAL